MTTLNTIIEEENVFKKIDDYYREHFDESMPQKKMYISELLTSAMQRAYEAGRTDTLAKIPMLRQWLNEDKITDVNRMVTNEQIRYWLTGEE